MIDSSAVGDSLMIGTLQSVLGLLALVFSVANIAWTWIQKGQTASTERAKKSEDDIVLLKQRVQQLEGDYKHLPTKEDISGLRVQLEGVIGQQRATQSELANVNRVVSRIDDFLREKA